MNHHHPLLRALMLTALLAACALAAPGDLDTTFGSGGRVTTVVGTGNKAEGNGVAVQSDGKILIAGTAPAETPRQIALVRLNTDGSLDTGFNGTGKVTTVVGSDSAGHAVAVQGDGKILVAGQANSGTYFDFALVRYNADGSLDTGFGAGAGMVLTPIGIGASIGQSVAVQGDGKIVVAGGATNIGNGDDFALARYNADGSLDTGFNATGIVMTDLGGGIETAYDVTLQSDGKILVAGFSNASGYVFGLVRYNANGSLDTSFNGTGIVKTTIGISTTDLGYSVEVQTDGKILVAGQSLSGNYDFALVRYNTDGSLDTSFNSTGKVVTPLGTGSDYGQSVVVQGDGKVVVGGFVDNGSSFQFALVRYNTDGSLDTSFNNTGKVVSSFDGRGLSIALQADGNIVLAGTTTSVTNPAIVVARYLAANPVTPGGPLDPPVFDTLTVRADGAAFLNFGAPTVDSGIVGGAAQVTIGGRKQTLIYGGANGDALAQTGMPDVEGATFIALGDPVFAGEGIGFAGTALQTPSSTLALRLDARLGTERLFAVKPGGKLAALYSQLTKAAGIKRLAAQAGLAPGGGQFAKFGGFGLPRTRGGLVFTGNLHRSDGVTAANDFGVWREKPGGGDSDLVLRTGKPVAGRTPTKLVLMTPVANATDQRRSFAPDGAVAAMAKFDDRKTGIVTVAADGTEAVPLHSESDVPDEAGGTVAGVTFKSFTPPATGSGGKIALLAALQAAAQGLPPPPAQAIFSNQGGPMSRVMARGDDVPGRAGVRFGALGQPAMGQTGMIGLIAALTGQGVKPPTRQAIVRVEAGAKTVVARLGDPAPGAGTGVVFKKFGSMVVTDSDPARVVFTATVGGPGVNGANNTGLWSYSAADGALLLMRKGGTIKVGADTLTIRTFDALQAPKKNVGQGRSTDATGFVTAKAKLSDGRQGVLRIPLP